MFFLLLWKMNNLRLDFTPLRRLAIMRAKRISADDYFHLLHDKGAVALIRTTAPIFNTIISDPP